ncbi:MAG: DEAD/DEAH box helicase, partial [Actinobacteria bacterium]
GRLKDLNQRKRLNFAQFQSIVLDEVDRMLDMGFIQDVSYMIDRLPSKRHSLFFSATTTPSVKNVMKKFLNNPVTLIVETEKAADNVDQDIIKTNGRGKVEVLHDLLIKDGFDKVLVFGRTKRGMEKLSRQLDKRGFDVASIHGDKTQAQRQRALKQFRNNHIQALLATDVASRGLDIDNVTHVINYDLPETYEDYVHRIGRTGRANKIGSALTFVT